MKMDQQAFPILTQDQSTLDWSDATYMPTVSVTRASVTVHNALQGADELVRLIGEQKARWAIEARCPRTLMAIQTVASDTSSSVKAIWDETDTDVDLEVAIIPGLVVVDDCELDATGLTEVWRSVATDGTLKVSKGAWLARGNVHWLRPRIASLLKFYRAHDQLRDGRMSIQRPTTSDTLTFRVYLAEDIYPRWRERWIWHVALVGACAQLPHVGSDWDDESPAMQDLHSLRSQLEEAGVDLWDSDGHYDPALAATAIERLRAQEIEEEEDE